MRTLCASVVAALFLCTAAAAHGQAESPVSVSNPMPTSDFGFNLPTHLGTLTYSLSGSEMVETGYGNGSVYATTSFNGNLAYLSKSKEDPFSIVYSGGVLFSNSPSYDNSQIFQNVAVSQVLRTKSWILVGSDSFSYLPGTPTTGLSGVAGVGDVGVFPVQNGIGPTENILTNYTSHIANGLEGSLTWQTTPSLDLEASASWQILHYMGNDPGLNTDSKGLTFGPNYRIDARNTVGAEAYYSESTYPGHANYIIETEGASASYSRDWTRRLSTTFSFGPARSHGTTYTTIPSQWNLAGSAQANYATRTTGFYASYARGVNAGSGVLFGALSDTIDVGMNRPINRDWSLGLQVGYSHDVGLAAVDGFVPVYDMTFGSAQVSRRLTESLSVYASYTALSQSGTNEPQYSNAAFNGLNHIFAFGITFAPAPLMSPR